MGCPRSHDKVDTGPIEGVERWYLMWSLQELWALELRQAGEDVFGLVRLGMLFRGVRIIKRYGFLFGCFSSLLLFFCLIIHAEAYFKAIRNAFDTIILILDLKAVVLDVGRERTLELRDAEVSKQCNGHTIRSASTTYHSNDLAVKLLVVGDHLGKTSPSPRYALNQSTRHTVTNADGEDTDISVLGLVGNVVKHPLLRPYIPISKQYELGGEVVVSSFAASLNGA
jgi:hypothetical protein